MRSHIYVQHFQTKIKEDWPHRTDTQSSIFSQKSGNRFDLCREIQEVLTPVIHSWGHSEANSIIPTHQSIQNHPIHDHGLHIFS